MFAIPKLIREMDPGRLDVFSGKYARQRASIARHVDDVAFVETFCIQKGFAAADEEAWVSSLPWASEAEHLPQPNDPLERLKIIEERSMSATAQRLATIARLYVQDWSVWRSVSQMSGTDDPVAVEAMLAISWWRMQTEMPSLRKLQLQGLATLPFPEHVAVRLALLGAPFDAEAVARARMSADPDLRFAAVLADANPGELSGLLDDADQHAQNAAAMRLARTGQLALLDRWLRTAPTEIQHLILQNHAYDKVRTPSPLRDALVYILEHTQKADIVDYCGMLLARRPTLELALRVAQFSRGQTYVVQALMRDDVGLTPSELGQVAVVLAERGWFSKNKYGVDEAARRGALPDDLIVKAFDRVDDEQRIELCYVAEQQLGGTKSEITHGAVMRIAFGPYSHKVRAAACWALSRWYASQPELGYRSKGPMALEPSAIARFFPSISEFLRMLIAVLNDYATLKEVGYYDWLAHLFGEIDAARARALDIDPVLTRELVAAMRQAAAWDVWSFLQTALTRSADLLEARAA